MGLRVAWTSKAPNAALDMGGSKLYESDEVE
jgi:hypothetical protein